MKKLIVGLFFVLPVCAFAVEVGDCAEANRLLALYQIRSMVLRGDTYEVDNFINTRMDELRGPQSGGGFRWVRWVRPSRDPEYDKKGHTVVGVQGSSADTFEAGGDHAYAVRIAVPGKRSLFKGNNPVYVGTVRARYTVNGRERTKDETINNWMNPDTSRTIDLGAISDHVDVSVDSSTKPNDVKEALVEIHLLKAVPQDDPANPNYDTIVMLKKIKGSYDSTLIDDEIARRDPVASFPLVHFMSDLRKADELIRSKKQEDKDKGDKLLQETLRRLR